MNRKLRRHWILPAEVRLNLPRLQASILGRASGIPLSIDTQDLSAWKRLAGGSQSLLFASKFRDRPVAVKKAIIRTTDDLENFRKDVLMSAEVQHQNVLGLIAARLLPPGEPSGCSAWSACSNQHADVSHDTSPSEGTQA